MSVGDVSESTNQDIEAFYDFLYDTREGYVYAATKELNGHDVSFKQYFFAWPMQRADLLQFTVLNRSRRDVYVAPSMFSDKEAVKDKVIGATVVWAEFDDVPSLPEGIPNPTCRIASGGDGHEHWYWKLDQLLNSDQLDIVNRALTYHLDADPSGWDSTQILRPPGTFNHKRKRETSLITKSDIILSPALFGNVPEPPVKADVQTPTYIPPVEEVFAKYSFHKKARDLFLSHDPSDRSDALMSLGYFCAEMGMARPEILSMILNADERWGKFKGRDDRMRRLLEIVSIAVTKYPDHISSISTTKLTPMGFKTLLATEVKMEWQWEGFLQKNGYFLLTGPTGVGKTQFSLDAAGHMALGRTFLDKPMSPAKIGFFSLEMGLLDLKHFVSQMQFSFSLAEQEELEKNLLFFPLGEPLYVTDDGVRETLDQVIGDLKLDGIMIDSLGSATDESLSDEKAKNLFHWNDRLRQTHNIFTWYIHHHRKASGDNRKPNKISDVYGSQYITSYATSVACLWETGVPNYITFIDLKKRLSPRDPPFVMCRDEKLHFARAQPAQKELEKPSITPGISLGLESSVVPVLGSPAITGPADLSKPVGGKSAADTAAFMGGSWSMGPKSLADLDEMSEKTSKDSEEVVFNLNMKELD